VTPPTVTASTSSAAGSDPPTAGPVLIYIHGGAWVIGDKREQGLPLLHELARRGWVTVTINYRLSPKATWPDHLVDCKLALAWVREHIAEYGGDPRFIAVSGGSAGGHLCSMLALTPGDPAFQPGFEDAPRRSTACIPFYGVYDMSAGRGTGHYDKGLMTLLERRVFKRRYDDDPVVYHDASPLHRVNSDAPPFFVVHGTHDTLVPVAEARRFVEALRAVSDAPVLYAELPYTQHAFDVCPRSAAPTPSPPWSAFSRPCAIGPRSAMQTGPPPSRPRWRRQPARRPPVS